MRTYEHSRAKVKLYKIYLSIYLNIIQRDKYTKKIHIYDLFCGEGEYPDGSKGSPLAALDVINEYFKKNKNTKLIKILFNDDDAAKIEKLKKIIFKYSVPNNCQICIENEDYQNLVKDVINDIEYYDKEKGLVFIDHTGYKYIKFSDIKRLLLGNKTEVILFLPVNFMYRFSKSAIDKMRASDLPLKMFLEEVFYPTIPDFNSVHSFISQLRVAFKDKLGPYFIDTFTLERDTRNIYCLFFFTSHIRGFEKMLEVKWKLDEEEGRGFKLDSQEGQGSLFQSIELDDFKTKLRNFISSKAVCSNKDLYEFGLHHGYLPKHMRQILLKFQKDENDENLEVIPGNKKKIPEGAFYLNYQYHSPVAKRIVYFKFKD